MKKIVMFLCAILGIPSVSLASNGLGYYIHVSNFSDNDVIITPTMPTCIASVSPKTVNLQSHHSTTITVITNDYSDCKNQKTGSLQYFTISSSSGAEIGQVKFGLNSYSKGHHCANYVNEGVINPAYVVSHTMKHGNSGYYTQNMNLYICDVDNYCDNSVMGKASVCY